ncbi:MAG: hypothetical protein ACREBV_00115 [Candidatus Zixiibacteriota bacterium]
MRCQKAQQLMNDKSFAAQNEPVSLELAEHLRGCPHCAEQAAATEILNRAVTMERTKASENETPLSFLKSRIETLASTQNPKEHVAMSSLKSKLLSHPILSFGTLGVISALFLMAVIPVSCSRDVGYSMNVGDDNKQIANAITSDAEGTASITFANDANSGAQKISLNPENMIKSLKAIGIADAKLQITANQSGQTIQVSGLDSREQAREALLALVQASGFDGKVELATREASVDGSLLEQAFNGIKELVFSSEGKTDEQVRSEITAALEAAGITGAEVQYNSTPDGRKTIFVGAGGEGESVQIEQAFKWNEEGAATGLPGDSNMVIEITSDGNAQTVEVKKTITEDSDD